MQNRIYKLIAVMVVATLSGCTFSAENIDHTGDQELEAQIGSIAPEELKAGMTVYVSSQRLNLRSSPEMGNNLVGILDLNNKLEIVGTDVTGENEFVKVKILESKLQLDKNLEYYTSAKHLNAEPVKETAPPVQATKFFVVINVATEKVRVYKICDPSEGCVNKMIFEQDVVNGEDKDGTRTDVGSYRIVSWDKFYEIPGVYPAWYRPGYPSLPRAKKSPVHAWFDNDVMPNGKGDMRGAFGWYTAKVGPNPRAQWIHGTAGWGADKKYFIMFKESFKGALFNIFTAIRSHGCTRIDNESIAYLRSILPIGTPYVKIYAKEAYRDVTRANYLTPPWQWSYILTKVGYGKTNNHQEADRALVLADKTPESEWLDQGTLEIDEYPDAVPLNDYHRRAKGGDLYELGERAFRGYFLVDEGTVVDYEHPSQVHVSGYPDRRLPNVMYTNNKSITVPQSENRY